MADGPRRPLVLPAAMAVEIVEHAVAESPRECCGVIGGRDGKLETLFRLANVAPGTTLYEIDPAALVDLEFRRLPELGLEVGAIYHSHPASAAYPSRTDVALAAWPDAAYLICSLADPSGPVIRAFQIAGDTITELEMVVT